MLNKAFFKNLPIAIIFVLISVCTVFAASTATQKHSKFGGMNVLVITWVADASDGSFTSYPTQHINGVVGIVETNPGTTAPTALYDITLKNADGLDIMDGKLSDRSATATESEIPYNSGEDVYLNYPVKGPLTIAITNNSVNSATGTISIFYATEVNIK